MAERSWQGKVATPAVLVVHQRPVGGLDCNYDGLRLLSFRAIGKAIALALASADADVAVD